MDDDDEIKRWRILFAFDFVFHKENVYKKSQRIWNDERRIYVQYRSEKRKEKKE